MNPISFTNVSYISQIGTSGFFSLYFTIYHLKKNFSIE